MSETEREQIQQEDRPFRFRGGTLALDLVNTESMKREKSHDLLVLPQDVALWWQAACRHHPQWRRDVRSGDDKGEDQYDTALLEALKTLRAALRRIFGALVENATPRQEDITVLNKVLRTGYWCMHLSPEGEMVPVYHTTEAAQGQILLSCALSALHLIREGDRTRLHHCESERCILFFYDTTRSATRRWCSTDCMDRARSLQRYRQARQASS